MCVVAGSRGAFGVIGIGEEQLSHGSEQGEYTQTHTHISVQFITLEASKDAGESNFES